jgi:hypothetical protein
MVAHDGVFADPIQRGHGTPEVGCCAAKRRSRSMEERGGGAGQSATACVCLAEGSIRMRPPEWTGSSKVALSRPQRPLAAPRGRRLGHAPPPPRPFGSSWRQCCGHCLPRSLRISKSPSAEADGASQSARAGCGKGKGEGARKLGGGRRGVDRRRCLEAFPGRQQETSPQVARIELSMI